MRSFLPPQLKLLDHRIVEVPRLEAPSAAQQVTESRGRMLPALAAAYATGATAVSCWLRAKAGGSVAVLVGGSVTVGAKPLADGCCHVNFPAGTRARPVASNATAPLSNLPFWQPTQLSLEPLLADDGQRPGPQWEELFALLPSRPMGVAVVAEPVERSSAQPHLDDLSDQVDALQSQSTGRGSERLKLDRADQELRYLERWSALGFWTLEIWTGGASEADCAATAAMLGSSASLAGLLLRLQPEGSQTPSDTGVSWSRRRLVGADAVAAVMRSPNIELPGLRVVNPVDFDMTPEVSGTLRMGAVLDATRSPSLPFSVPVDSVNRHVFVTGATGAGKSETVRSLLEQLAAAKVPWLVIEPAKSEYARMAGRVAAYDSSLAVIRPGQPGVPPASLNPLEPSSIFLKNPTRRVYFRLQTHLDLVRALFTAAFQADEPFPQILARALTVAYEGRGWNLALGRAIDGDTSVRPTFPTLSDLQRCALEAVDAVNYGKEVRDNVRGFVDVRIGSLRLGTPGRFFENGHPLDLEKLMDVNTVFEIEDIGDDRDKAFFIGTVLIRLYELLRLRQELGQQAPGLRHVTVIEEAHRLLRRVPEDSPTAQAVTMFANLMAEVRAYGEGIVVAEQIPAKIISDVVKNSAVKLVHRLPAADDRAFVGGTMNLSVAQSEAVVALAPGVVAAHVDGMDRPVLVAIDATGRARDAVASAGGDCLVTVRSSACPKLCATSLCTLDGLVESAAILDQPRLVLWAEIATLAHLTGDPMGRLREGMLGELRAADAERLRCAIGLAVSAAVSRRSRWVRRFYEPWRLERAVADAMAVQMTEGRDLGRPDPMWQIARFRWADVRRAFDAAVQSVKDGQRPFRADPSWTRRGLTLSGSTWAEQRASLSAIEASLETPFTPTFLGTPVAIDAAAAQLSPAATRGARLKEALSFLQLPKPWPSYRLYSTEEN